MLFFLQRHYFTLPCWIYYSTTTVNAHALQQPIYQWKASPGSILAANVVSAVTDDHDPSWTTTTMTTTERTMPRVRPILATSGHSDGGTIRFWPILVKDNTTKDEERGGDSSSTIVIDDNMASLSSSSSSSSSFCKVHDGSIFTLSSSNSDGSSLLDSSSFSYLVSGSFDRSASIHRVEVVPDGDTEKTSNNVHLETIGVLPDHTGWVRGVQAVHVPNNNDRRLFPIQVLSIGCNLINVWTIQQASASRQKHKKDSSVVDVVRVARLDAGPSPDDPPQESAFRRHDILSIAVVVVAADPSSSRQQSTSSSSSSWIVAGLVDGTIRVFSANFQEWANRIDVSPYDATGSCDCATTVDSLEDASPRLVPDDETPCCSTNAHTGRVTCVLCIPDTTDFVSVGYDGRWVRWRIIEQEQHDSNLNIDNAFSVSKVEEGYVPSVNEDDDDDDEGNRILCATVVVSNTTASAASATIYIYIGTKSGCLYRACLASSSSKTNDSGGECKLVWRKSTSTTEAANHDCSCYSITAITHAKQDDDDDDDDENIQVFACRSDGIAMVFQHY